MVGWLANFALIEVVPVWQNAITLGGVLARCAALCVLAIVFVYGFVPEIMGLPAEEIIQLFEQRKPSPAATRSW